MNALYRKKPVIVQAVPIKDLIDVLGVFGWEDTPAWVREAADAGDLVHDDAACTVSVQTLEGWMTGGADSMLIRGVKGEIYPCRIDIFELTYDPA